jgi:hypothetical protein
MTEDPFDIFFDLMDDLADYREHLVVVGGWVPWIYREFLWRQSKYFPVKTSDIDIGVKEFFEFRGEQIAERLKGTRYASVPVYSLERTPVQISIRSGSEDYPIDFITGEYSSPAVIQKMTGKDLYVSAIDFFDFLLRHTMGIPCGHRGKEYSLVVPTPAAYFFHKAITLLSHRDEGEKWKKDLYYLFYILDNMPPSDGAGFLSGLLSFRSEQEYYGVFIETLRELFHTVESKGPKCIVDFFFNPGPLFRKYVWERFQELLKELEGA